MIQLKCKQITEFRKTIVYKNPKCGHEQVFEYSAPFVCQHLDCKEKIADVDNLVGDKNQDRRVKYFAEGKL